MDLMYMLLGLFLFIATALLYIVWPILEDDSILNRKKKSKETINNKFKQLEIK